MEGCRKVKGRGKVALFLCCGMVVLKAGESGVSELALCEELAEKCAGEFGRDRTSAGCRGGREWLLLVVPQRGWGLGSSQVQ